MRACTFVSVTKSGRLNESSSEIEVEEEVEKVNGVRIR